MDIESKENSNPTEALKILKEEDEDDLTPEQRNNLEFLRKNIIIQDTESFEEMKEELEDIDSLKEKHIIKLLEILPEHEREVSTLFSKERVKLEESEVERITDICKSYKN